MPEDLTFLPARQDAADEEGNERQADTVPQQSMPLQNQAADHQHQGQNGRQPHADRTRGGLGQRKLHFLQKLLALADLGLHHSAVRVVGVFFHQGRFQHGCGPGVGSCLGQELPVQGTAVVAQCSQLLLPAFQLLAQGRFLLAQALDLPELLLGGADVRLTFGDQARTVVAAAVFQLPELRRQPLAVAGLVAGGHQGVEPAAQGIVGLHRKVGKPQKARALKYALFHAQQHLAAVVGGQLPDGKARLGLPGQEIPHGDPATAPALDGDVPALVQEAQGALHGLAGPGQIFFFFRQIFTPGPLPGVDAVEHGGEEGAPGGFAPLVGGGDHIQTLGKVQGLPVQLAEGGGHG